MVDINYAEEPASGPPILLLHGLATRWQVFRPLIRLLEGRWYLYALDFRGHGKSGRVPSSYNGEDFVEDTLAFVRSRVAGPAVIVGHSMGGWVAAAVAARAPDLVRAIVLVDTALYPAVLPDDVALSVVFGVDPSSLREHGLSAVRSWPQALKELDPDVVTAYLDGRLVHGFDTDDLFPHLSCPVLLLQGDPAEGGLMTDEDVERAFSLLAHVKHMRFDGAGHWLHVQDPAGVARETEQFLAATP